MAGEKDKEEERTPNGAQSQASVEKSQGQDQPPPAETPFKRWTRISTSKSKKGPPGGFDDTPIPKAPPGYTVKITFHRATNLPLADISTLSSDPYLIAQIYTSLPTRHKEDPPLRLRTHTIRQKTDPVWNTEWIVANIPASGFGLKCRLYDEDSTDHDDRLGNVLFNIDHVDENWGIKDQAFPIKKRTGSKRAYLLRSVAVCFGKAKHMHGFLHVSMEVLGRTQDDNGGRVYTVGPQYFFRHYSPMLGRLLGQKEPQNYEDTEGKPKPQRYNFQANQMQLHGPVPEDMYHRYVEFKPFVKSMFTAKGIRGFVLSKALHHQHARVYKFNSGTEYGVYQEPCKDYTLKFLDLVHYDQGGRIFTYVLTLDALFRFTETGKEFGIDMLSKHTMHSDVSTYVAFSGEFFIRRLKHHQHKNSRSADEGGSIPTHPPDEIDGGPPKDEPRRDPALYELVIDNDSGTYRPNAKLLPQLKTFLETSFPGLKIITLDCQGDAEKMKKMKDEQRERKKKEGEQIIYTQISDDSSISSMSSSDLDELDRLEETGEYPERHFRHQVLREVNARADAAKLHLKEYKPSNARAGWKGGQRSGTEPDLTTSSKAQEENSAEGAGEGLAKPRNERSAPL